MSLTLILTRHAKSSWSARDLDDFDRPLNARGMRAASMIGVWLAQHGHRPDEVILSGARRTVETWNGIATALDRRPPVRTEPALYLAEPTRILDVLRTAVAPVTMLIGHNPGFATFAARIVAEPSPHPRYPDYPTGATAVIAFDHREWRSVGWRDGRLIDFVVPRDLPD